MEIAIVAPASVDGVVGGAENLYKSLSDQINHLNGKVCEIVTLPSPERNTREVIQSYKNFLYLDLKRFDLVISTKYPSWMVTHKNHICYMLHPLRGLYDTYHLFGLSDWFDWEAHGLSHLKQQMQKMLIAPSLDNSELKYFFDCLDQVLEKADEAVLAFPGPFIREVIHFLDGYALSLSRIKRHCAISSIVARRENYFPKGSQVKVLSPEPLVKKFKCKKFNYIFTVSRLDSPKRIDFILKSFKYVRSEIPLIIAGDGPERENLKQLASQDKRVQLIGRISDKELIEYYANALAVVYVPYDEDYGYTTIEAMRSRKPVITAEDSGGPNEFVQDGVTGLVVPFVPKKLANAIDFLSENKGVARFMGEHAFNRVKNIRWTTTVNYLLSDKKNSSSMKFNKPKMVVLVTFSVFPPMGGGQVRIFNFYKNLTDSYDIELVCLCSSSLSASRQEISPGLIETRVPVTEAFERHDQNISKQVDWVPVTDIAAIEGYKLVPDFCMALERALDQADVAVISHPFLIHAVTTRNFKGKIFFEAQDVEYDLKKRILPDIAPAVELAQLIFEVEKQCWLESEVVYACSDEDLSRLEVLYGQSKAKKLVVPNGVDCSKALFPTVDQRQILKEKLGCNNRDTVFFLGSWHGPNLEAVEKILALAPSFPTVNFWVVGSAGLAFAEREIPNNVTLFGELTDQEKEIVLCASDVAINPMDNGSGSNLKMLDYFAHGMLVITTPFGARGIEAKAGIHFVASDTPSMALNLSHILATKNSYSEMREVGHTLVTKNYDWSVIAQKFLSELKNEIVGQRVTVG